MTPEEAMAMAKQVHENCARENKLSDVKLVLDKKLFETNAAAATQNQKCFLQCAFRQFNILDAAEKIIAKDVEQYLNFIANDKSKVPAALKACLDVKGADNCDLAFNLEKCLHGQII